MNIRPTKMHLVAAIALALTLTAPSLQAANTNPALTEGRQEAQIWTTYALSPYLRANDIHVSVSKGKATLTGSVDEDVKRDLAKQIALGVVGITSVDNQLTIREASMPTKSPAPRSYADVIDDANLTTAVRSKLSWDSRTQDLDAHVSSLAGKVTLTGTAGSAAVKSQAEQLVRNTRNVTEVDNQLKIAPTPIAPTSSAVTTAANDLSDGWITTKIKSSYMYSSNVDSRNIHVSTMKGRVTLSGRVGTGAEQALATEIANNILGVKSVDADALIH